MSECFFTENILTIFIELKHCESHKLPVFVETSNLFYRLGSGIILPALVRYPEVLPTLETCAVAYHKDPTVNWPAIKKSNTNYVNCIDLN
jgi:ATP sulfurylase